MAECPICGMELSEHNPGIDNWFHDPDGGYIVREMICGNKTCPLFEKQQDWFFDFSRVDVDGDEIDENELRLKHDANCTKEVSEDKS